TVVFVEALLRLAAETAVLHEVLGVAGRLHAIAEGLFHDVADLVGDVDADLVEQRDGTDGKAEVDQRAIDVGDVTALGEQVRGLVHVRREDARRVEADAVVDADDGLALALAGLDARRRPPVGRLLRRAAFAATP